MEAEFVSKNRSINVLRTYRRHASADVGVDGVGTAVVEGDHVGVYQITLLVRVDLIRHNIQYIAPLVNAIDVHKA